MTICCNGSCLAISRARGKQEYMCTKDGCWNIIREVYFFEREDVPEQCPFWLEYVVLKDKGQDNGCRIGETVVG
jgi:hypothetical protein